MSEQDKKGAREHFNFNDAFPPQPEIISLPCAFCMTHRVPRQAHYPHYKKANNALYALCEMCHQKKEGETLLKGEELERWVEAHERVF